MKGLKTGMYGFKREYLLTEKKFLKVEERARKLNSRLTNIEWDGNTSELIFTTASATRPGVTHTQVVGIDALDPEGTIKLLKATTRRQQEKLLLNSGLHIYCSCEAFLYWGYKYKAWQMGYGMSRENRAPNIRNPKRQGFLCKHLYEVLDTLPYALHNVLRRFNDNKSKIMQDLIEREFDV